MHYEPGLCYHLTLPCAAHLNAHVGLWHSNGKTSHLRSIASISPHLAHKKSNDFKSLGSETYCHCIKRMGFQSLPCVLIDARSNKLGCYKYCLQPHNTLHQKPSSSHIYHRAMSFFFTTQPQPFSFLFFPFLFSFFRPPPYATSNKPFNFLTSAHSSLLTSFR